MKEFIIRKTTREDSETIFSFINAIAKYEKMEDCVKCDAKTIEHSLFDLNVAHCLLGEEDGIPVGFALYFYNFSTFEGIKGLYLEDLFVNEDKRGCGYGKLFFKELAKIALDEGCVRMEWTCLNWNTPSIEFYDKLGAVPMSDWTVRRLTQKNIERLANS